MFSPLRRSLIQLITEIPIHQAHVTSTFSASTKQFSTYKDIESSWLMQKMLAKRGAKTKKKWYQAHISQPLDRTAREQRATKLGGTSHVESHRARQLSHVLYARICQIVNSGELSEDLLSKAVIFTKVKMHPTFNGLNVYWDARRSDAAEIEILLNGLAGKLRSELISYHILGKIPKVTFVKDKSGGGDLVLLNELFEKADYGPDYTPSDPSKLGQADLNMLADTSGRWENRDPEADIRDGLSAITFREASDPDLQRGETSDPDQRLAASSSQIELEASDEADPFSSRSDLYGLQRDELMRKVIALKKKVKYQSRESEERLSSPALSEIRQFSEMKSKRKAKEKIIQHRESTKEKQRILEQDFVDAHH